MPLKTRCNTLVEWITVVIHTLGSTFFSFHTKPTTLFLYRSKMCIQMSTFNCFIVY